MKKFSILILLAVLMMILTLGCGQSDRAGNETSASDTGTTANAGPSESGGTTGEPSGTGNAGSPGQTVVVDKDGFTVTDLGNGNWVLYKAEPEAILKIALKNGEEKVICKDLPSPPSVSPDGKRIAYLSPYQWEVLSNVHLYDIDKAKDETVWSTQDAAEDKNVREQFTPKLHAWLDDRYLLMVVQYAYGTVVQGGDLFVYDTREDSLQPLSKLFALEQITALKVDKDLVCLDFIEFTDEAMKEYQSLKKAVKAGQIYDAIRKKELVDYFHMLDGSGVIQDFENELEKYKFNDAEPFIELSDDLNGDGKKDTIKYQIVDNTVFILKVNDLEIKSYGDNIDEKPYIVDIDRQDSVKEIAVQEFGPSSDERTYFYCYTGSELRFMGKLDGLSTENRRIKGDGKVISMERPMMLHTWFVEKEYKLDGGHLLEGIEKELYPVAYEAGQLKLKTGLKLYDKPKSKNIAAELKPGDTIKLLGCDGIQWCCAETAEGTKGWFAVDGSTVRENGLDSGKVFEGLSFAD